MESVRSSLKYKSKIQAKSKEFMFVLFPNSDHTVRASNLRQDLVTAKVSCEILMQSDWSIMMGYSEEQNVNITNFAASDTNFINDLGYIPSRS